MGLDMYLMKRKKLTKEEQNEINFLTERRNQIDNENQKEYDKIISLMIQEIGKNPYDFLDEANKYDEFCKKQDNFIEEHQSEKFKTNSDLYFKLEEQIEEIKGKTEQELGYWRKHADLNKYMADLYYSRGGKEEFNCVDLILTKEDCENIITLAKKALNGEEVEKGEGFFWGTTEEQDWKDTVEFFEKALKEDFNEIDIIYSCWW